MIAHSPWNSVHLVADVRDAAGLDDPVQIEQVLRSAAEAAGATVLDVRLHHFGTGHGVTGVALLAESRISIHSWPEHAFAAIDIFPCGERNNVDAALATIVRELSAEVTMQQTVRRGV